MNSRGFTLIEIVLALAIVSMAVTVFLGGLLYGSDTVVSRHLRVQARLYAGECVHVARWIRDIRGLDALTAGTHGLVLSGGSWELSGTSDESGPFTRTLAVGPESDGGRDITCSVVWESQFGDRDVSISTRLAEWEL